MIKIIFITLFVILAFLHGNNTFAQKPQYDYDDYSNLMNVAGEWLPQAADRFFDFLDNLANAVDTIVFTELLDNLLGLGKAMLKILAAIFSAVTPIIQNWSQ